MGRGEEGHMEGDVWLWLILAVVVIAAIVAAVIMGGRQRKTKQALSLIHI